MKVKHNTTPLQRRAIRVRSKVKGTAARPRVSVFRSNKHLYVQVIDDSAGKTLISSSDIAKTVQKKVEGQKKMERAKTIVSDLVEKLKKAKIMTVVFDRGGYRYHGVVKLVAQELRELGIQV